MNQQRAARKRTLETVFAHMPGIVVRPDRDPRQVFIRGEVGRIIPLAPRQFIGRTRREPGFPAAIRHRFECIRRQVFHTMRPAEVEIDVDGAMP